MKRAIPHSGWCLSSVSFPNENGEHDSISQRANQAALSPHVRCVELVGEKLSVWPGHEDRHPHRQRTTAILPEEHLPIGTSSTASADTLGFISQQSLGSGLVVNFSFFFFIFLENAATEIQVGD